jgi:hypothetical protein
MRRITKSPRVLAAVAALVLLVAAPALAGPPWIAIEVPPNPFDSASRDAFVIVRTYHHGNPQQLAVTATAEGLVRGERRSVKLDVNNTSRAGVFAIKKQWPSEGVWTLVIMSRDGQGVATALVDIGTNGEVAAVRVPTRQDGRYRIPREVAASEVDATLRQLAQRGG